MIKKNKMLSPFHDTLIPPRIQDGVFVCDCGISGRIL